MDRLRFLCLIGAMGLYAVLSSPTPDHPGLVEAVIGGLLCVVALPGAWRMILHVHKTRNLWQGAGALLMIYGLSVPLCLGLIYGQDTGLIVRDVVPFLFMGLALFASDLFVNDSDRFKLFLWAAAGVGFVQAARSLFKVYGFFAFDSNGVEELYYLANSPFVLLCAALCIAGMMRFLMQKNWLRVLPQVSVLAVLALVPLAAMALTLQRASLGYVVLFTLVLIGLAMVNRPSRGFGLVVIFGAGFLLIGGDVWAVFEQLFRKTQEHGFNMRVEEWRSVWAQARGSWSVLLFGQGWGTAFESPAVAGVRVNFTHSLFSSMILKTGLVGAALVLAYLVGLTQILWAQLRRNQVLALALAGPFLIDVLLYATFKSLDFGLLLLLIPAGIIAGGAPVLETRREVR